jgi:ectoine hydroxylase
MLQRDPHDDASGQITFGFLEIIADGQSGITHAGSIANGRIVDGAGRGGSRRAGRFCRDVAGWAPCCPGSTCDDGLDCRPLRIDDNAWGNAMQLSADQIRDFDEYGYLFFPNCFSEEEIALLRDDAEAILKLDRQEVWREKTGAPRTAFAAHTFNETFRLLASHPRLVEPLRQLYGEDVYVHQFKLNAKAAFEGDVWQWHQDYGTWARDDGMPQARAMNIAVFLDEVMPINGALMLIPKSHKQGVFEAGHDVETTSYPLWTLDKETVTQLASEGGIVAPTGKPGSVLMFHGNLVHASPPNITPYPRKIVYLTLCAVSNHITKFTRPEWIAHRDFTPIMPVTDDALLAHARSRRVAA